MKKKVLITGANGMIGTKLVRKILSDTVYQIVAVVSSKKKFDDLIERLSITDLNRIDYINTDKLIESNIKDIYAAIHLAFSRRNRPVKDIALSIDNSAKVFKKLAESNIQRVINISSQGVYGNTDKIRIEKMLPAPMTTYTMAKYATEKIFENCFENTGVEFTSLRLDLVIQSQNLVPALCKQAKEGKINLKGGEQRFSFIDVDDVVRAIVFMLNSSKEWENVYNVGWNKRRYTLTEVAGIVSDVAVKYGYKRPEIILDRQDIELWSGMNSQKFSALTGWKPEIDIYEMIKRVFAENN